MKNTEGVCVRAYEVRDRETVRRICCDTGFLGKSIDSVFEDRELFADYLTSYYTDIEPESSLVLEQNGIVKGYLLGSCRPFRQKIYDFMLLPSLALRALLRYHRYGVETRKYIAWILKSSRSEVPPAPARMAHFHFNVLPEAQSWRGTQEMIDKFFAYLREKGEKAVYGQLVSFESRRGEKALARMGFQVVSRSEITKWRGKYPEPVYLSTAIKKL